MKSDVEAYVWGDKRCIIVVINLNTIRGGPGVILRCVCNLHEVNA
jgi:hypothetical protein